MARLAPLLAVLALFVAACGGGDGDDSTATPSRSLAETPSAAGTMTPLPNAREVTDEEYLAVICTGLDNFSSALNSARTVEEIRATVEDFIANLQGVTPAADVRPFHGELIAYLTEALDEPTELATSARPLPEEDVRERLADKEADVPECDDLTFFAGREDDGS